MFLAAFFTVYGLVNLYIFIRGWQVLSLAPSLRLYYALGFFIVASSFIGGRLLENVWLSDVSDVLCLDGSLLDCGHALLLPEPAAPGPSAANQPLGSLLPLLCDRAPFNGKRRRRRVITGSILLLLAAGHVNARIPRVQTLHLTIPKKVQGLETLNVVAASDIHLGSMIGKKRLDAMVARINALNPDLVLLPGDIVDEDLAPVIKHNLGDTLRNLSSRWGVFAVTGNHEYIGGVEEAYAYLSEHGVTVLREPGLSS